MFFFVFLFLSIWIYSAVSGEVFSFQIKGGIYKNYVLRVFDKPELKMEWLRLKDGGYVVLGSTDAVDKGIPSNCRYLTDLQPNEIIKIMEENYGFIDKKITVRSLNAVVEPNKKPEMADPYMPELNPTEIKDISKWNVILKDQFEKILREDKELRSKYLKMKDQLINNGLDPYEANLEVKKLLFKEILKKVNIKRWIDERLLPKKLFLLCQFSNYETLFIDLFPVSLSLSEEGKIKVISLTKTETDLKIKIKINFFRNRGYIKIPLDVLTLEPKEVKKIVNNCSYNYIGLIPHYDGKSDRNGYKLSYFKYNEKYYLFVFIEDEIGFVEFFLRPGLYCGKEVRKVISMLNPVSNDKTNLLEIFQEDYRIEKFMEKVGLEILKINFKITSPEGYNSDKISITIP